ncbi:MAG: glycosyltransferase [Chloroflexota bacterium]|nr:glycosyltransferase [Chloroflexota bacterium]
MSVSLAPRKSTASEHITFILTQSLECPSGVGRYWPLAQGLAARGYRVRILALHPNFDTLTRRRFNRDRVAVWYVGQMHVQKTGSQKRYFSPLRLLWVAALATFKLTWAAITSPSDLYHIGKAQPMNGVVALVLLAMGRRVYLDCDDYEAVSNRFGAGWQRKIVTWFEDRLPAWVHGVTVNTSFLQARIRSLTLDNQQVVLVPNAVSSERFRMPRAETIAEIQRQYRLKGRSVVIYVGSMNLANHPVDLLLESFVRVVEKMPQAILMLVGGGVDLTSLQNRVVELGIEQNTRFVGRVPPSDVPAYYAAADISVDPVLNDEIAQARSPLKLYESLAVGTPVVTGDIGDRRQALGNNESMLVPAGDADALGKRLVALLQDSTARASLKGWAIDHREQFFWEKRIAEFICVYEST